MLRSPIIAALVAVARFSAPSIGVAQDLSGSWRSTRDNVTVTVREWGPGCGPRPSSRSGSIGREATVRATTTSLSVDIGGRTLRSDRCWSDNRDVAVRSTAHPSPARWVTTCSTPEGASLAEHATYTISADGDRRLSLHDETEYEWNIEGSVCRARSVMVREYERIGAAPTLPIAIPTPPAAEAPPTPPVPVRPEPPVRRCARVGVASVLVVSPSRRSLPVGGRTCFRVRVLDAARCEIDGAAVVWTTRPTVGAAETTTERGCVVSTRGEGVIEITATAGALSARALATVVSEDQYRSLAAAHIDEEDASVEAIDPGAGQSLGVSVTNENPAARPNGLALMVAVLGGLAMLGVVGSLVARRKRKPIFRSEPGTVKSPVAPLIAHAEQIGRNRREAAPVEVLQTALDLARDEQPRLAPQSESVARKLFVEVKRCPVCAKEFRDESVFCSEDGAGLFVLGTSASAPVVVAPPGRICPRCRRRYEPLMDFCVDDGVRLNDA